MERINLNGIDQAKVSWSYSIRRTTQKYVVLPNTACNCIVHARNFNNVSVVYLKICQICLHAILSG
jgi:hypothetical protein